MIFQVFTVRGLKGRRVSHPLLGENSLGFIPQRIPPNTLRENTTRGRGLKFQARENEPSS